MTSILTRGARQGQGSGGSQVILDVASLGALKTAVPAIQMLNPGDRGQIVLTGPGLGIAADLSGAEAAWRTIFARAGLEVRDVSGEGFRTAIIEWYVPAGGRVASAQGEAHLGSPEDANMGAALAALVLVGAIIAVLLFLGWLVLGRILILLDKFKLPEGALGWLLLVGGIVLVAAMTTKAIRGERATA